MPHTFVTYGTHVHHENSRDKSKAKQSEVKQSEANLDILEAQVKGDTKQEQHKRCDGCHGDAVVKRDKRKGAVVKRDKRKGEG